MGGSGTGGPASRAAHPSGSARFSPGHPLLEGGAVSLLCSSRVREMERHSRTGS